MEPQDPQPDYDGISLTFDALRENEILAMYDRQQQTVTKLTPMEQFYTNVSKVYDDQLLHQAVPKITAIKLDDKPAEQDENEDDDEDEEEEEEEEEHKRNSVRQDIRENLDKARYELDQMVNIVDRIISGELLYKLSRPVLYPQLNAKHYAALSQQKESQFSDLQSVFRSGLHSVQQSIQRARQFSQDLLSLSQFWRLTTLDVLQTEDNYQHLALLHTATHPASRHQRVFIDFRLQRNQSKAAIGLLPLFHCENTGNIQIYTQHQKELTRHLKSIQPPGSKLSANRKSKHKNQAQNDDQNLVGFDDSDNEEMSDNDNETADSEVEADEDRLRDDWRICEFVYHSQINVLYFELFRRLKMESTRWNPLYYQGVGCRLESNGIRVHTPSFHDFSIRFTSSAFLKPADDDDDDASDSAAQLKWNKVYIAGDATRIDPKLSKEIEHNVILKLFERWQRERNQPLAVKHTLRELKMEEANYNHNLKGRAVFDLNSLIGKYEEIVSEAADNIHGGGTGNDALRTQQHSELGKYSSKSGADYTECELLEYIINTVNHHRIANELKTFLISFSERNTDVFVKWNQIKAENKVNVLIGRKEKLLVNVTLNGIRLQVQYTKSSKLTSCRNVQELESLLSCV